AVHGLRGRARPLPERPARADLRALHHPPQLAATDRPGPAHHDDLRVAARHEGRARVAKRALHRLPPLLSRRADGGPGPRPARAGIGVIGIVMALGIKQVETRLLRWRPEYRKGT